MMVSLGEILLLSLGFCLLLHVIRDVMPCTLQELLVSGILCFSFLPPILPADLALVDASLCPQLVFSGGLLGTLGRRGVGK